MGLQKSLRDLSKTTVYDYLPLTGLLRDLKRGKKHPKYNPDGVSTTRFLAQVVYTFGALSSGVFYTVFSTTLKEPNPLKWDGANQEILQQIDSAQKEEMRQRESIIKLMVQDSDFNGNGSLEEGVEMQHFIKNIARSNF